MTNQQLWQAILGNLEVTLSKANFTTWFKNTAILEKNDDNIVVSVPNSFTKEWLQNKYNTDILKALRMIAPEVKEVKYQIVSSSGTPKPQQNEAQNKVAQGTRVVQNTTNTGLNPKYTFETFIVGKGNELAYAACNAVSKKPGMVYNPLFLYGGVGLGKTHLMQAIGHEVLKFNPSAKVMYVTSEKFTNEFVQSISLGRVAQFKELYRGIDVLMIDDIQFLAGKEQTQEEFFHTFNTLHQNNKQVILSSDRLPKDIPAIEERLVSRFEWGMIADIQAPDFETRLAILKAKALEKNYDVDTNVLTYIAETIQSNIRELEGALNRLMVYCQLNNTRPTIEQVKAVLVGVASAKKRVISVKKLMEVVADFYNITLDDLLRQSRRKEFVKPRQIAMYLMREELENSFPSIGEHFGGRDHTTVMHAVDKISKLLLEKESLKQELDLIVNKLYM
ncbi:MAG: dnaA [Candidatus Doudnabacteria bacterium]|nr:dnaA [Candidatus Doudnabacteria bacterium]